MERISKLRTALYSAAKKELDAFESILKEEIWSKNGLYVSEIGNLQQEINFLRQQVSRVSELEDELHQIRARQGDAHGKSSADSPPIDEEEENGALQLIPAHSSPAEVQRYVTFEVYDNYRRRFLDCSQELERVKGALKYWQGQAKRWKLNYRNILPKAPQETPGSSRQNTKSPRPQRPSSAPMEQSSSYLDIVEPKNSSNESSFSVRESSRLPPIQCQKILFNKTKFLGKTYCMSDFERPKQSSSVPLANASEPPPAEHHDSSSTQSPNSSEQQLPQVLCEGIDQLEARETDSDNPVIVSERTLKRKRGRTPPQRPKSVKEEILSSSPNASHADTVAKGVQESVDLDDVSNPLCTPRKDQRKRQRMDIAPSLASAIGDWDTTNQTNNLVFDSSNEPAEDSHHNLHAWIDKICPRNGGENARDKEYFRRQGEEFAAKLWAEEKRSREARRMKAQRHNAREIAKHRTPEVPEQNELRDQRKDSRLSTTHASILQPIDANQALPRTHDHSASATKAVDFGSWHYGAQHIQSLAEDGENDPDTENTHAHGKGQNNDAGDHSGGKHSVSMKTPNAEVQQRLDRLLAGPTPSKPPLSNKDINAKHARALLNTSKATPTYSMKFQKNPEPKASGINYDKPWTIAKPRNHPPSAVTPIAPNPQVNYITPFSKPRPTKPSKPQPSLRSRPLSQLSLNDFKINPKQNQGYEHPFKETVRKKDQRKCLPGCTRLDCCGKIFRQMAETGLFKPFHTTRFLNGGSSQDYNDDQTMMEDYLGDQAASRLRKMSKEEKAEVLLRAKTKILADHYGRHREVYAREPSPVGYWDVDMPNSQEAEELGRLAEIRNRQKVEERYRDAMRQDGIWQFRDE